MYDTCVACQETRAVFLRIRDSQKNDEIDGVQKRE